MKCNICSYTYVSCHADVNADSTLALRQDCNVIYISCGVSVTARVIGFLSNLFYLPHPLSSELSSRRYGEGYLRSSENLCEEAYVRCWICGRILSAELGPRKAEAQEEEEVNCTGARVPACTCVHALNWGRGSGNNFLDKHPQILEAHIRVENITAIKTIVLWESDCWAKISHTWQSSSFSLTYTPLCRLCSNPSPSFQRYWNTCRATNREALLLCDWHPVRSGWCNNRA